jgi:hypothetical protein
MEHEPASPGTRWHRLSKLPDDVRVGLPQRSTAAELVAAGVVAVLFFSPLALRLLATGTSSHSSGISGRRSQRPRHDGDVGRYYAVYSDTVKRHGESAGDHRTGKHRRCARRAGLGKGGHT